MTNARVEGRQPNWVPDDSSLGARLALIRQAMGWNVAKAATECGIPIASWRNWENRGKEPHGLINVALKISGVTGIDHRWIALGPLARATPADARSSAATLEYPTIGERVVTIGTADRSMPPTHARSGVRTRPIAVNRLISWQAS